MFKKVTICQWRQFENIEIEIDDVVTIITGANGAGKTTILGILNQHFGWSPSLISTPLIGKKGVREFFSGIWDKFINESNSFSSFSSSVNIGSITYGNGQVTKIMVPTQTEMIYHIQFENQQSIDGMYVPSHRPVFNYKEVTSIPTTVKKTEDYFDQYNTNIKDKFNNPHYYGENISPSFILKETLISLATFGYGNAHVVANMEYANLFEEFQKILEKLLPQSLGFQKLEIRIPEVVLITKSGDFSLDAVSGGVASLIGLAWQIFIFSKNKSRYVITLDEPENHLHPSMQRELMPNLVKSFPNAQFIVATHSPFIVGSLKESKVYALAYNENNRVYSRSLDMIDKSGNASKILREVLGVPVTLPIWVENKLESIISKYSMIPVSETLFEQMRQELVVNGLEEFMPNVIVSVVEKKNDQAN